MMYGLLSLLGLEGSRALKGYLFPSHFFPSAAETAEDVKMNSPKRIIRDNAGTRVKEEFMNNLLKNSLFTRRFLSANRILKAGKRLDSGIIYPHP
jgi:hypothetical protein